MSAAAQSEKSGPRIALFVEEGSGDWHARRLQEALEARAASVVVTSLNRCAFDSRMPSHLDIPGFDGQLPDAAFVRSISTGSLEAITLRLGILHALESSGVPVWNGPRAIEACVDKSTTTFRFARAGLPVPATRAAETRGKACAHLARGRPLVFKPLFGSQGNGLRLVTTESELPAEAECGGVYYLQEFLPPRAEHFEDWRVFVSSGRVLAAMARRSTRWVTNVHQGATPIACHPDAEMSDLALLASQAVGANYAGVDMMRDASGRLTLLEINSNPAWKGLSSVTDVDIAETLAGDFLADVGRRRSPS